jgi:two-component system response regulator GlrR
VRELENAIERAVVFSSHKILQGTDIALPYSQPPVKESLRTAKSKVIAQFEKNYVQELLVASQGNISKAAKAAQKNRRAFWELIRKYRIKVQHFKFAPP